MTQPNHKDQQVSHWDLDYMTDAQREAYAARQRARRHADEARQRTDDADSGSPTVNPDAWKWTGLAAVLVAVLTALAWLLTYGPLA